MANYQCASATKYIEKSGFGAKDTDHIVIVANDDNHFIELFAQSLNCNVANRSMNIFVPTVLKISSGEKLGRMGFGSFLKIIFKSDVNGAKLSGIKISRDFRPNLKQWDSVAK